jgi:tetratricopeptide (TPR) repeat protein/TolB-like protein
MKAPGVRAPSSRIRTSSVALGLTLAGVLATGGPGGEAAAEARLRTALVLPFQTLDLGRDERWLGDGVRESVLLGLAQVPQLIPVDRQRVARLPQPEAWDDAAAAAAGRAVRADVVLYGELRRNGGELVLQPKLAELRGERVDRTALDSVTVPEGALLLRLADVPVAFVRALKLPLSDADAARVRRLAAPTTVPRAFEAYVRGQVAAGRGGKEAHETAVEHLARAMELDPQFVAAVYALGVAHQGLGNRWKAAAQFRAASQLDPTAPEPLKALGDLFLTGPRRLFNEAVEAYSKAIELRPFFAEAHVGLGDARAAKGDVDGAIAAYQKALVHNPLNPRVHVSLGKIYYSEKSLYYESVNAYKRAIDLDPRHVEARMGLAEVYEDKGLYDEAVAEYRTVVAQDPRHTGALYNLALVYEKVDPKEAIVLWERYIELAGSLPSEKDWVDVAKLHLRKLKSQHGGQ